MPFNYIEYFKTLRSNLSGGYPKPYKPALLLAVIESIETGEIQNNRILITPELIASFRKHRETLGASTPYQLRHFVYPFYHLRSKGFWQLKEKPDHCPKFGQFRDEHEAVARGTGLRSARPQPVEPADQAQFQKHPP